MPSPRRSWPFFVLTFAFTWSLQIPGLLAQRGLLPGAASSYLPLAGLGILGPLFAAIVMTRREGASLKSLFVRILEWRAAPRYYLAALAPAVLLGAFLYLLNLAGRHEPIAYVPTLGGAVAGLLISTVEEIGWRGFALPRLQERWGSFAASGILGTVWYAWHLPMFLGQGVPSNLVLVMLLYFWGASLLLTWLSEGSRGGLLLPILGHFAAHLNNSHRALPHEVLPLVAHAIVYAAVGLTVMHAASSMYRLAPARKTSKVSV